MRHRGFLLAGRLQCSIPVLTAQEDVDACPPITAIAQELLCQEALSGSKNSIQYWSEDGLANMLNLVGRD